MQGKIGFFTSLLSLLSIWLITKTSGSSLLLFGIIFSVIPVFILLIANYTAFNNKYKAYKPTYSLWKKEYLKDIFGLGFKFFIIQMSGIVLFSTDNIIISQIYSPEEVVPYSIAYKYFGISNMIISIVFAPYWSAITEAYIKKDFKWIKKSMNNLIKLSIVAIVLLGVMILIAPFVYQFWIGDSVSIPFRLSFFMSVFFMVTISYAPFTYFVNGTGKVRIQLYALLLTAIINIPLSYFLSVNLDLGVSGVIVATIICLIPHTILTPIQYFKIINNRAYGIWNK